MSLFRQLLLVSIMAALTLFSCSDELIPPGTAQDPVISETDSIPDNGTEEPPVDDGGQDQGGNNDNEDPGMYFPSDDQGAWSFIAPDSLEWNTGMLGNLIDFLDAQDTRAFLVLYKGHIVVEHYHGLTFQEDADFTENSKWYWASAGKAMTAFLVGVAREQGSLSIDEPSSVYLGSSWSSLSEEKQQLIRVKDHLRMTTGLDEKVRDDTKGDIVDDDCTKPECLQYKADAGTRWVYHNAPYNLLDEIIANASGITYEDFSKTYLEIPSGMQGEWRDQEEYNKIYWSSARDAARFGLLMLNEGNWDGRSLMDDPAYFKEMTSASQPHNSAYGYLWWLNNDGPGNFFAADAPESMYTAAGLNGQFIDVVPELDLVVVRFGLLQGSDERQLHGQIWEYLKQLIGY